MKNLFYEKIEINPIIAAINNEKKLEKALNSPCEIIFLLKSSIVDLKDVVDRIKSHNKAVYVHMDLVDGLSRDVFALKYIHKIINPDGIITTRPNLVKAAKNLGIFTIERLFILDSLSLKSGINTVANTKADAVEILPGIMNKVTQKISQEITVPMISGGLISDKEDVIGAIKSGAVGISTSKEEIWYM